MSDQAKHLLAEAKAQAKKEFFKKLILRNQKAIKLTAILATIFVIFCIAFASFKSAQITKYSALFQEAITQHEMRNYQQANESFKKIFEAKFSPSEIKSFAGLRYAAGLLDQDKKSEAAKVYEEISKCFSCDQYLKNLSALLLVKLWMSDEAQISSENLPEKIRKIENSATILRNQIAEQRGILQLQKNNLAESYKIFDLISKSQQASQSVKSRAQDYLNIIISKGYKQELQGK